MGFNQKGFSLVEVMVAVGLLAIVGLGAASQMAMTHQYSQFTYRQQGRDQAVERVASLATSAAALYWSAAPENTAGSAVNSALAKCVLGDSASASCKNGKSHPLTIYLPNTAIAATSTSTAPVYLDQKTGNPCPGGPPQYSTCTLMAVATFTPLCPYQAFTRMNTCDQAEAIMVQYEVRDTKTQNSVLLASQGSGASTTSIARAPSSTAALRMVSNTVMVPTAAMALYKAQSQTTGSTVLGCPADQVAVGVDGLGNVLCQSLAYLCPTGSVALGVDRYGRPISKTVPYPISSSSGTEGVAAFQAPGQTAAGQTYNVYCIAPSCVNQGLTMGIISPTSLTSSCFVAPAGCAPSDGSTTPPSALIDITPTSSGGTPQISCAALNSCWHTDPSGTGTVNNFTDSISDYSTTSSGGIVSAKCEPFKCTGGVYMESWSANGRCLGNTGGGGSNPTPTPTPTATPTPPTTQPTPTPTQAASTAICGLDNGQPGNSNASQLDPLGHYWSTNAQINSLTPLCYSGTASAYSIPVDFGVTWTCTDNSGNSVNCATGCSTTSGPLGTCSCEAGENADGSGGLLSTHTETQACCNYLNTYNATTGAGIHNGCTWTAGSGTQAPSNSQTPVALNGQCGSANGQSDLNVDNGAALTAMGLCQGNYSLNPAPVLNAASATWSWTCAGVNGGSSPTCTATGPTGSCSASRLSWAPGCGATPPASLNGAVVSISQTDAGSTKDGSATLKCVNGTWQLQSSNCF